MVVAIIMIQPCMKSIFLQSFNKSTLIAIRLEAASLHFAAQLEGQQIDVNELLLRIQLLQASYDVVICEGAGGLLFRLLPQWDDAA